MGDAASDPGKRGDFALRHPVGWANAAASASQSGRSCGSPATSTDLASGSDGAEHHTIRLLHPGERRAETRCIGLVRKNVAYGSEDSALRIEASSLGGVSAPLGDDGNWDIVGNYVHDNNEPNEAPRGSMSADLPPGGGILVLGVDRVNIQKNRIERNNF